MLSKEEAYDLEIFPHMNIIIQTCKAYNIPFVATFQITTGEEDEQGPLYCTTVVPAEGQSDHMKKLGTLARNDPVPTLLMKVYNKTNP